MINMLNNFRQITKEIGISEFYDYFLDSFKPKIYNKKVINIIKGIGGFFNGKDLKISLISGFMNELKETHKFSEFNYILESLVSH